jgi:adenosylcobinamide-GDP ribazoletransferase
VSIIATQTYARIGDAQAKAQPFAVNLSAKELFVASVFGLSPLFLFSPTTVLVLIPVTAARLFLGRQLHRRIGGYTGDCLGAVQQLTELTIYLFLIATV